MTGRFPNLRAAVMATVWAMDPVWHALMVEMIENRAEGIFLTPEQMRERAAGHSQIAEGLIIAGVDVQNGMLATFEVSESGRIFAARAGGAGAEPRSLIAVINVMGRDRASREPGRKHQRPGRYVDGARRPELRCGDE